MAVPALAQSPPAPETTMPQIAVGVGPSWTRGDAHAISADVAIAIRIGSTAGYSWSEISTPVAKVPTGTGPLPSTITTGGAYRIAQSATGAVSLWGIGQAGFTASSDSYSLALSGSAALSLRVPKTKNLFLFPYAKLAKPQRGTNGALVGGTLQPGIFLTYGFGK
jgi:hypothetical protein